MMVVLHQATHLAMDMLRSVTTHLCVLGCAVHTLLVIKPHYQDSNSYPITVSYKPTLFICAVLHYTCVHHFKCSIQHTMYKWYLLTVNLLPEWYVAGCR